MRSDTCSYGYQETRVVEMNDNSLFDPGDVFRGVNDVFRARMDSKISLCICIHVCL